MGVNGFGHGLTGRVRRISPGEPNLLFVFAMSGKKKGGTALINDVRALRKTALVHFCKT